MSYRVSIKPRAVAEMEEARKWLEDQRDGLGQELVGEIRTTISSIQAMPKRFKELRTGYRRALVHRFNYVIVFRHDELKVTVVAVYHASRNPGTLSGRIDEDQAEGDNDDDPSTPVP